MGTQTVSAHADRYVTLATESHRLRPSKGLAENPRAAGAAGGDFTRDVPGGRTERPDRGGRRRWKRESESNPDQTKEFPGRKDRPHERLDGL
jgi:hypothetical protein